MNDSFFPEPSNSWSPIVGAIVRVKAPSAYHRHDDPSQVYLYEKYYDQIGIIVDINSEDTDVWGDVFLTIQFDTAIEGGWLGKRFTLVGDSDVCSYGEYNEAEFLALLGGVPDV